jgi:hypothetical protein
VRLHVQNIHVLMAHYDVLKILDTMSQFWESWESWENDHFNTSVVDSYIIYYKEDDDASP